MPIRHPLLAFCLAASAASAAAAPVPTRVPLAKLPISPVKPVTRVETTRVEFAPRQEMPEHKHNVPVVCFVTKGAFRVSIGRDPVRAVKVGDVTLEPAGAIVHYFRNASASGRGELLCASLASEGDTVLNVMLNEPTRR